MVINGVFFYFFLAIFLAVGLLMIYFWRRSVNLKKTAEDNYQMYTITRDIGYKSLQEAEEKLSQETLAGKEILKEAANYEGRFMELSKKYGEQAVFIENLCREVERYKKLENEEISKWKTLAEKNLSERKSSEVRVGKIAENFAPFLEGFRYDPKLCHFVGQPIDFIVWEENKIVFVEVKSGKSAMSKTQRNIRDIIEAKEVYFEVFRINEKAED